MHKYIVIIVLFLFSCEDSEDKSPLYSDLQIIPLEEELIYKDGRHNAFTDLCEYSGKFYLCFRNALSHVPQTPDAYGRILIMESADGVKWDYLFSIEDECDLRDPKLVVDSKGNLNIYCGYSKVIDGKLVFQGSKAGKLNLEQKTVQLSDICAGKWIWSVTWHYDMAYSFAYDTNGVYLLKSGDGYSWEEIYGYNEIICNEASLFFVRNRAFAVLRTASAQSTVIGYSDSPYVDWTFTEMPQIIQSPNTLMLDGDNVLLAGRLVSEKRTTCGLFRLYGTMITDTIWTSDAAFDNAYPGLLRFNNNIYLSFYSGDPSLGDIYLKKFGMEYRK